MKDNPETSLRLKSVLEIWNLCLEYGIQSVQPKINSVSESMLGNLAKSYGIWNTIAMNGDLEWIRNSIYTGCPKKNGTCMPAFM